MAGDRFTPGGCFAGAGAGARARRRHEFPPLEAPAAPEPPAAPRPGAAGPAAVPDDEAEPSPPAAAPAVDEAELAAAVTAARCEGFAEGEAAGRAEAEVRLGAERERALARLAERLAADGAAVDEVLEHRTTAAVELALAAARAVVREALGRLPLADVEAMLRDCLGETALREQPALELALHPSLAEPGEELLHRAAAAAGFRGALTVTADPVLGVGDARLHWRDGWAERDVGRLAAEAEAVVRRRLSAPAAATATGTAAGNGGAGTETRGDEEP